MAFEVRAGLWMVLRTSEGSELGRFLLDPSEIKAALRGTITYQASDGRGNCVSIVGESDMLRIRIEALGHAPKNCRIERDEVESVLVSLNAGV